jgi:hypothetical protein
MTASRPTLAALAGAALALSLPLPAGPGSARAASAPPHGPTLAIEDTMRTEVPEVLVRAPRVTLDEILDRVARGEARRESLMTDQRYLATARIVREVQGRRAPEVLMETVAQVYKKRPDRVRSVTLREYVLPDPKRRDDDSDDDSMDTDFGAGMSEDIVHFAFRPAARREYRYRIVGREILGPHLIYRIAFEPRSALAVYEPSGEVWVDTRDDVIVRQEVTFRESPVPLFLKGIRRMTVERTQVDGHWVLSRVLARVEATIPLPRFGRAFDFGLQCTDYAINRGIPDSVFTAPARGSGGRRRGVRVGS